MTKRSPQQHYLAWEIIDVLSNWYHREGGFWCRGFNPSAEIDALVDAVLDNDCHTRPVRDDSPDWTPQPRRGKVDP